MTTSISKHRFEQVGVVIELADCRVARTIVGIDVHVLDAEPAGNPVRLSGVVVGEHRANQRACFVVVRLVQQRDGEACRHPPPGEAGNQAPGIAAA